MNYKLPETLRPVLATPFGPVHDTDAAVSAARNASTVIAVGDVVTQTLLDHGIVPKVAFVDGVTQRGTKVEAALAGLPDDVRRVSVANPAAHVTRELVAALETALATRDGERTVITVDGEEDLAALPAMILAPDGALVVYGQPPGRPSEPAGEDPAPQGGVVVVVVTSVVRERAKNILQQMES